MNETYEKVFVEIKKVISGKDEVIKKVLTAFFAGGHILLEDVPGVGKTTLGLALSRAFSLDFRRIQFTPDTVASDITGFTAYDSATGKFVLHEGAAMSEIVFADELNRTSGKTQAALLEVMEERHCTVDGHTLALPENFTVIATENPVGTQDTNSLPLSELDRFMVKISMGRPDKNSLIRLMRDRHHHNPLEDVQAVCSSENLAKLRKKCENVFMSEPVYEYIADLCVATEKDEKIAAPISPRGALALCKIAKSEAFCNGRDYVIPTDVSKNFTCSCAHRIELYPKALANENSAESVLSDILNEVKSPTEKAKLS
jgi:MoxR-like ATPase